MKAEDSKSGLGRKTAPDMYAVNVKIYKPRQTIISEGEKNEYFYVILQGSVEVFQKGKSVRVLKEEDVFGIENFFLYRPYTTTVRALTTTRIATYSTKVLKDIIYTKPQLTEKMLISVLSQLEQTTQIAKDNIVLEGLIDLNEKVYEDGEVIIKEGAIGYDFFRLLRAEGGLLVTKEGKEVGRINKSGEFFGEMSGLLSQPRSATVTSVGKSVVQVFSGANLDEIIESYPKIARKLLEDLAYRLAEANKRIIKTFKKKGTKKHEIEEGDHISMI